MPHKPVQTAKKNDPASHRTPEQLTADANSFEGTDSTESLLTSASSGLNSRQQAIMAMQHSQGNAAVQRFLAGRGNTIQRDPPARTPTYAPPSIMTGGNPTLPDNARIDSMGSIPDLPGQVFGAIPAPFADTSFGTAAAIRTALNRETLRNNFNAYQGGGVSLHLQQVYDWIATFDGDMTIQAKIKNPRFVRADGVTIGDAATSGVSTGGSGSTATATGVSGEVNANAGDPKAGGNAGGKVGGSSTTTVTSGATTGTAGSATRTVSPNASAVFSFDIEWKVTVTYQRSPRTWNAIMSLGMSSIDAAITGNQTSSISATSSGGQVRIPVVDCTEVAGP